MANDLFNRFGGNLFNQSSYYSKNNSRGNIISQLAMLKNNPGAILDIMFQNGKINQQQYNDLQQYRNNPQAIFRYLVNNGMGNELNRAEQVANQINSNYGN